MSIADLFKSIVGTETPMQDVEGTITEKPTIIPGEQSVPGTLVFRLDAKPDLEFHHEISPLAAERHRGDRIHVHYHEGTKGVATVEWIERA